MQEVLLYTYRDIRPRRVIYLSTGSARRREVVYMPEARRLTVESPKHSVPSHEIHSLETSQRNVTPHIIAIFPTKEERPPRPPRMGYPHGQ